MRRVVYDVYLKVECGMISAGKRAMLHLLHDCAWHHFPREQEEPLLLADSALKGQKTPAG